MGLPLWVKPSRLGSSVGISKVTSRRRISTRPSRWPRRHDPRVIIEASAPGARSSARCSATRTPETSLPGEIVADADWYDFEAKYTEGGMDLVVPAPIGEQPLARVRELAARVFTLAGCTGLARCDFFVEHDGEILLNEINTIPGFTETSVYAKLFEASGIPYPRLCRAPGRARDRAPPVGPHLRVLSRRAQSNRRTSLISTP